MLVTTALLAVLVGDPLLPPVTPRTYDHGPISFRFDMVSPPRRPEGTVSRVGDPIVVGSLEPEEIVPVVEGRQRELEYCYDRRLSRQPQLAGQVDVMFVVSGIGTVASARVASSSADDPPLEDCLLIWFREMQFPVPSRGQRVIVFYALLLTPD